MLTYTELKITYGVLKLTSIFCFIPIDISYCKVTMNLSCRKTVSRLKLGFLYLVTLLAFFNFFFSVFRFLEYYYLGLHLDNVQEFILCFYFILVRWVNFQSRLNAKIGRFTKWFSYFCSTDILIYLIPYIVHCHYLLEE
jgi:hypothetical protein